MSPETFPGCLNYVYHTTKERVREREHRDKSIEKNLLRDNIQLKSPAPSTSYPEEYKAALTPWIKKYYSPTSSSYFNIDYACIIQSVHRKLT